MVRFSIKTQVIKFMSVCVYSIFGGYNWVFLLFQYYKDMSSKVLLKQIVLCKILMYDCDL